MSDFSDIAANAAAQQQRTPEVTPVNPVASHTDQDFESNKPVQGEQAHVTKLDDDTFIINGRTVKRRATTSKQDVEEEGWTIDKFVQDAQKAEEEGRSMDGIIHAGEVDANHTKFLENTEWVE